MAKSFLQSLPSHRRKKGRHYTRRGGSRSSGGPQPSPPDENGAPASLPSQEQPPSQPSQQQSPESVVEETQVPFPPPRRRAWEEEANEEAADEDADNDVDSHRHEEEQEQPPSQRSTGKAAEVQLPPPGRDNPSLAAAEAGGARRVSADGPGGEPRPAPEEEGGASPVQASLPIKAEPDDDDVFDAETVMESPVAGRGGVGVAAYLGRGATLPPRRAPEERAPEHPRRAPEEGPAAQEEDDEQQDDVGGDDGWERHIGGENSSMRGEGGLERDRSLGTVAAASSRPRTVGSGGDALEAGPPGRGPTGENRDRNDEGKQSSATGPARSEEGETSRAEPEENRASENLPDDSRSQSSETVLADLNVGEDGDPMDGAGVPSVDAPGATSRAYEGLAGEVEGRAVHPNRGGQKTEGDELALSTSDVRGCVMATRVAKEIMEMDLSQDPFDGIDIERWQSVFVDFGGYLTTLGDETSEEAEELKQIGALDRVFAIFDRGMDVNHCNAVFIYGMIRTMVGGLEAYGKSHSQGVANRPSRREAFDGCKKLHHLASCLDVIFGVTEESDACPVAVSVGRAESDNATFLTFSFEPNLDNETPSARVATIPSTLPPHLHAMNQVFAQFVADRTRALQSQLDSAQKTLAATRDGAMDLQRRALKVQDDLQAAEAEAEEAASKQESAEVELEAQRCEFERKEESFERVKEHLKAEIGRKEAELAETKQKYQRALDEANAKHERAKQMYTEQKLELEEARRCAPSERRNTGRKIIEQMSVCGFIGTAGKAGATGRRDTERRSVDRSRDTERKSTTHKGADKRKRGSDREVEPRRSEHSKNLGMKHRPDARDPAEESGADDQISPSLPRNIFCDSQVDPYDAGSILGDPWECGSRKRSKMSDRKDRHSSGNAPSSKKHSAPFELAPPRRSRSLSEPRSGYASHRMDRPRAGSDRRSDERRDELGERGGSKRNPLKSLADNGAESDDDHAEKKASRSRRERSTTRDGHDRSDRDRDRETRSSNVASSSTKQPSVKNPYLKPPKSAKTTAPNQANAKSEPSFAFQEVVRGKKDREALPGHECEECKRFMDAVGGDYDRDALVQGCSRHRSRCAPPLTPPGFWNLTFVDSVSSNNKSDSL